MAGGGNAGGLVPEEDASEEGSSKEDGAVAPAELLADGLIGRGGAAEA